MRGLLKGDFRKRVDSVKLCSFVNTYMHIASWQTLKPCERVLLKIDGAAFCSFQLSEYPQKLRDRHFQTYFFLKLFTTAGDVNAITVRLECGFVLCV